MPSASKSTGIYFSNIRFGYQVYFGEQAKTSAGVFKPWALIERLAKLKSDTAALLSSLRVVSRVKGVSRIAEVSGLSRKGVQKALSENSNPQFSRVNAIMHAMGYRLTPQKLPVANHTS